MSNRRERGFIKLFKANFKIEGQMVGKFLAEQVNPGLISPLFLSSDMNEVVSKRAENQLIYKYLVSAHSGIEVRLTLVVLPRA